MQNIPVKLDDKMVAELDHVVERGLYLSRSEALREGARRLVLADYMSAAAYLRKVAEIAAQAIIMTVPVDVLEIRLFGSVARSTAGPDSDIDLLVITRSRPTPTLEAKIHELLQPVMLATEVLITPLVMSESELGAQRRAGYSFARELELHGVTLAKGQGGLKSHHGQS